MALTFLNGSSGNDMLDNIKIGLSYLQDKCHQTLISYVGCTYVFPSIQCRN